MIAPLILGLTIAALGTVVVWCVANLTEPEPDAPKCRPYLIERPDPALFDVARRELVNDPLLAEAISEAEWFAACPKDEPRVAAVAPVIPFPRKPGALS